MVRTVFDEPSHLLQEELQSAGRLLRQIATNEYRHSWSPLLLLAATICAAPASARSYLNCLAKKVIIVDAPRGSNLSSTEDKLGFWIDEGAKTVTLADGTPLTVHRFDDHWISADRGELHYEFDRQNGNLMYASSTTKAGVATTTIGSGRCEIAPGPE
jgi:hypothetical protein